MALVAHHWNGAKRAVQLQENTAVEPVFWQYAFNLPDDFLRLISAHPADDLNSETPYSLQDANDASANMVLLSDSNQIYIQYIFDNDDITSLSQGFREVLNFVLARDLCMSLGKSTSKYELTNREYRRALTWAKSIDGMQDYPERLADGSWLKSRYGLHTDKSIVNG